MKVGEGRHPTSPPSSSSRVGVLEAKLRRAHRSRRPAETDSGSDEATTQGAAASRRIGLSYKSMTATPFPSQNNTPGKCLAALPLDFKNISHRSAGTRIRRRSRRCRFTSCSSGPRGGHAVIGEDQWITPSGRARAVADTCAEAATAGRSALRGTPVDSAFPRVLRGCAHVGYGARRRADGQSRIGHRDPGLRLRRELLRRSQHVARLRNGRVLLGEGSARPPVDGAPLQPPGASALVPGGRCVNRAVRERYGRFDRRLRCDELARLLAGRGMHLEHVPGPDAPEYTMHRQPASQVSVLTRRALEREERRPGACVGDVYAIFSSTRAGQVARHRRYYGSREARDL